jgi:hypothetical protein
MSWIKRIGLWSLSVLAADLIVITIWFTWGRLAYDAGSNFLEGLVFFVGMSFWLLVPGWLLVLPLILAFRRTDGWRLWTLGTVGILLGPAIVVITMGPGAVRSTKGYDLSLVGMGFAVSFLSTVMYPIALRWFARDTIEQAQT